MSLRYGIAGLVLLILASAAFARAPRSDPDPVFLDFGLGASVVADTTWLARYDFDSGPSCVQEGWTAVDLTAGGDDVGSFAELFNALTVVVEDPCTTNISCVWGFFNGSTSNYACGGWPSQPAVPAGDATSGYIHNEIWSPAIPLAGSGAGFELAFDVYRDLELSSLVFYTWRVRSIAAGVPGPWRDPELAWYGGGRDWHRQADAFGHLVEPGAHEVQVALGVVDMCPAWCGTLGNGACHSHAPLFDNVDVYRIDWSGPQWLVHPVDLFQDNFATDGTTTGTVRIDMARDINPRGDPSIRPGDSLVVHVGEPTIGLDAGPGVFLHVKDVSAAKSGAAISGDLSRWPVVPSAADGWTVLRFDSVRTDSGRVPGRFCVDLNDDLYTPGDTLLFYFSARRWDGFPSYWSEVTGTTNIEAIAREDPCEMTCLPAAGLAAGNDILYVDDFDGRGAQQYFDVAFHQLGIFDEVDRYDVRGPDYLAGNGPGSRVRNVATQLAGVYRIILWDSGDLSDGLVGDGTGRPEKSPDAAMLVEFLQIPDQRRLLYLCGDDLPTDLYDLPGSGAAALRSYIEYTLVATGHWDISGYVSPLVIGDPNGAFRHIVGPDTMVAYGGCPVINDFDVMSPAGAARREMRHEGAPPGADGAVISQVVDSQAYVLLSGFSFHTIRDDRHTPISDRSDHLRDILTFSSRTPEPCPAVELDVERRAGGVIAAWNVASYCYNVYDVRMWRYANRDTTTLVPVPSDTNLASAGELLDPDPVEGALNTYRLAGVHPDRSVTVLAEESVFVPAPLFMKIGPNPFNRSARIEFSIPWRAPVQITIFDVAGRRVATVMDGTPDQAGSTVVEWDGVADGGGRAASGVYFCRMETHSRILTRKIVLVR